MAGAVKKPGGKQRKGKDVIWLPRIPPHLILSFDSIIERAYARCGKSMRTGYELQSSKG